MPSFQDSAVIVLIALLLFGPKGLAKLAREAGKLMNEFRRASSEFRLQMEDEFRLSEQEEQQKKIAALEAASPAATPAFLPENTIHTPEIPEPEHPHMPAPVPAAAPESALPEPAPPIEAAPAAIPIASSGSLDMLPPATGLPVARTSPAVREPEPEAHTSLNGLFDSIPHAPEPAATHTGHPTEAHNG